jgi:CBS domain containing-hemolysin-like protein
VPSGAILISLLLLLLAAGSFFFAAAETAFFSLGQWRLRRLSQAGNRRAATVSRLLAQPEDLLSAIVLGTTLSNAFVVIVGFFAVMESGLPHWAALAALFVGLLLFGEVAPKALAVREPEVWALRCALPLAIVVRFTGPLHRAGQRLILGMLARTTPRVIKPLVENASDEVADLVQLAHQQGTLAEGEKEIILQILSLDRRTAADVMKPRAQMFMLPDDLDPAEFAAAARRSRHHRIPLYDESPDTIVAVLNTRIFLLSPASGLDEALEFPSFVPASMNLLQLFEALQRQQRGMAIVLDEFGTTTGLVTLEDILEAVIGKIRGEGEAEGFVMEKLAPGRWRVNGAMRLDDFRREFPELGEVADVDTLGGLALKLAEVVPAVGDSFRFRGLTLTVQAADERRVRELLVESKGGAA